ncbi:LysR substrate-binding domain-containing protein [Streptomyces thermocarboxydus]
MLRRYWRHVFRTRLTARPAVVVPDLRGVRSSVVAGSGVTVLPRYLCERELEEGRWSRCSRRRTRPSTPAFWCSGREVPRAHVTAVRECLLGAARGGEDDGW